MIECTYKELVCRFAWGIPFVNDLELKQRLDTGELPQNADHELVVCVARSVERNKATQVVLYINEMMDSSSLGRMQILCVGPSCTFKDWQSAPEWLNDLPSQRQYKRYWAKVP